MKRSYQERSSASGSQSPSEPELASINKANKINGVVISSDNAAVVDGKDPDHVTVVGAGPAGLMLA